MAEAFAALSIAANVAQFLDYARRLISSGKEIYNSSNGATNEHQALKLIIDDIKSLALESQPGNANSSSQPSSDEVECRKLAVECEPLADKLLAILKDLEVPNDARFRGPATLLQSYRGNKKKQEIEKLKKTIMELDVRLRERASRMLQREHYSGISAAISSLTHTKERLGMNTDLILEKLKLDLILSLERMGQRAMKEQQTSFDSLSKGLFTLVKEVQMVVQQQTMLQTLLFEEMEQRQEIIRDAHKVTLDWMFEKNDTRFMDWLETEKGIYWVKGKAGSGKSTLMKYICNHKSTLKTLRRWARAEQLFTASFFFWNSGFPMQKSQVGLLQSLLYQVLRACPALILEICASKIPGEPWKRKELFEALDQVSKQTTLPAKFCFFVDGLDEYEGDDEEIIALLQDLANLPSVKICVSSRPWNAFVDAFDNSEWKLILENLTRHDMRKYVYTMLVQNEAFSNMSKHDRRCATLVPQIAQKAQGVWLWVYLVVRDLLRDLKGEEEYPLLQRRLDSFPAELERYFEDILSRIDKIHRKEAARIFLIAVTAIQPFPLLSLHYLSMEAIDKDYALQLQLARLPYKDGLLIETKWRKLLNTRCRDLLEVDHACIQKDRRFLDHRVDFLHRTVRDFLRENHHDELLKLAGEGFDPRSSLCQIIVALTKVSADSILLHESSRNEYFVPNFDLVDEMLLYAKDFELTEGRSMTPLLDELDRVNTIRFNSDRFHWTGERKKHRKYSVRELPFKEDQSCTFLALAVQAGLRLYVKEKLEINKKLIAQKCGRPLLDYACRPKRASKLLSQLEEDDILDPQIVRLFLEHGSDPNQSMGQNYGHTVWGLLVFHCYDTCAQSQRLDNETPGRRKDIWYEAMEFMIDHGANPNAKVQGFDSNDTSHLGATKITKLSIFKMLDSIFGNDQVARLRLRMDQTAERSRPQPSIFWRLIARS